MKIGTKKTYAGVLDLPAKKLNGITIRHLHKPAETVLTSGNMRTAMFGQTSEKILFTEPTVWHELSENGRGVWMTDLPIEQRQTDELIARSHGRVLVGGLGLGYAVVALAARSKVKEIVVVEQNAAIIKLVWDATVQRVHTLFPKRKLKLSVIHADLFAYLKDRQAARASSRSSMLAKPEFDWGLFDIWQGDGETVFHSVVVPLRALAHGVVTTLVCWNEDVMRGQLLQGLAMRAHIQSLPGPDSGLVPSLETLTTDSDSIWIQWSVPFWRWFKDHAYEDGEYNEGLVRFIMNLYVKNYGRPEALNGLPALMPYRSKVLDDLMTSESVQAL